MPLPRNGITTRGYGQGQWNGMGNYHQNMRQRGSQVELGGRSLNSGGLNGWSSGTPQPSQYMQKLRDVSSDVAAGGVTPPYRASTPGMTPSQRRLVAGRGLPPTEPGGIQSPQQGPPPQMSSQSLNRFLSSDKRSAMTSSPPGSTPGNGAPALIGNGGQVAPSPEYLAKGAARAQAAKDLRKVAAVQRLGLPQSLAADAQSRLGGTKLQRQMTDEKAMLQHKLDLAKTQAIHEMTMAHHQEAMKGMDLKQKQKYLEGLQGLGGQVTSQQGFPVVPQTKAREQVKKVARSLEPWVAPGSWAARKAAAFGRRYMMDE